MFLTEKVINNNEWGALLKREHALSRHSQIITRGIIRFFDLLMCRDNVSSLLDNAPYSQLSHSSPASCVKRHHDFQLLDCIEFNLNIVAGSPGGGDDQGENRICHVL